MTAKNAVVLSNAAEVDRSVWQGLWWIVSPLRQIAERMAVSESLWERGLVRETAQFLTASLGGRGLQDRGPLGDLYGNLHALRLLAHAACGDGSVDRDIAVLEESNTPTSIGWARIAAAKAICALRRGDSAAALSALTALNDLTDEAHPLDRALCRALHAHARAAVADASYRSPQPIPRGSFVRSWVEGVYAPAADFVDEPPVFVAGDAAWKADPPVPVVVASANSTKSGVTVSSSGKRWIVALVVLFIIIASRGHFLERHAFALQAAWIPVALMLGHAALDRRRFDADVSEFRAARRLETVGRTDEMSVAMQRLLQSKSQRVALSAVISLGWLSAHSGDVETAQSFVDRALENEAQMRSDSTFVVYYSHALSLRIWLLALQGREEEAERVLAFDLEWIESEETANSIKFIARFWTALALGRREQAIEFARTCEPLTFISGRSDLARDALLSLGDPSAQARVLERIDGWATAKRLFARVCPWLLDALHESSATGVRVEATSASEIPQEESGESRSAGEGDSEAKGAGQ